MSLSIVFWSVVILWVGSEVWLAVSHRSKDNVAAGADRGSLRATWITIVLSIAAANTLDGFRVSWGAFPGSRRAWAISGLVTILAGMAFRWVAILTLGRAFTVDVSIASDHQIVERGPYRVLRHPSYTGGLLSIAGLAMLYANVLGAAVLLLPVTAAYLYRIKVEEAALRAAFGEAFASYARRTWRLVPYVY